MGFDADFLEHMQSVATYSPSSSNDGYGNSALGATSTFPCHITYKTKMARGSTEESSTSTAQIQAPPPGYVINSIPTPTIAVNDHITLPDGIERRVLLITLITDETTSPHHQSVMLT